jgi:DNA gyrase subunit A
MAVTTKDYEGNMLFFFENGKAAKVELASYKTVTKRRKLKAAYYEGAKLAGIYQLEADGEYLLKSTAGKYLILNTGMISAKAAKNTQGVQAMTLKKNSALASALPFNEEMLLNSHRFRTRSIPATGQTPREDDKGEQLSF